MEAKTPLHRYILSPEFITRFFGLCLWWLNWVLFLGTTGYLRTFWIHKQAISFSFCVCFSIAWYLAHYILCWNLETWYRIINGYCGWTKMNENRYSWINEIINLHYFMKPFFGVLKVIWCIQGWIDEIHKCHFGTENHISNEHAMFNIKCSYMWMILVWFWLCGLICNEQVNHNIAHFLNAFENDVGWLLEIKL